MAFIGALLSGPLTGALEALQEVDEVSQEKLPDGRIKVIFVTSGINPDLTKIKTWLWSLFAVPVQLIDEYNIETLQSGPLIKRYKITVILKPAIGNISKEGLGLIKLFTR